MIFTHISTEDVLFQEVAHAGTGYFCIACKLSGGLDLYCGGQVQDAISHLTYHEVAGHPVGEHLRQLREELRLCEIVNARHHGAAMVPNQELKATH